MPTRVVHIRSGLYTVRCDRRGPWGNRFRIGVDGTREEVLAKHRAWAYAPEQEDFRRNVRVFLRDEVLGCWCHPDPCHCDTLAEIADAEPV